MSYRTYYDDLGDENVELDESSPWSLPEGYREREIFNALVNIAAGADRSCLPVSRTTLHTAVQDLRSAAPGFGSKFRKDPRKFSSTPRDY